MIAGPDLVLTVILDPEEIRPEWPCEVVERDIPLAFKILFCQV
jgi:hypothetical protein